jgi:hypothetical protein
MPRPSWRVRAAIAVVAVGLLAAGADAQFRGRFAPRLATPDDYDGSFHFCRGWFRSGFGGDGGGWAADYPWADINLSIRLGEMTKTTVSKDSIGDPKPLIMRMSDPTIFQCGFVMMTEVGSIVIDDAEAKNLRNYLLKGGFLWVDDFWGPWAWDSWEEEISRVLPPSTYPIRDLSPDHPIYRAMFQVAELPQIPSIQFWRQSGGRTSERGSDSAEPHFRGIVDDRGRLMVLITHNTDISDAWEREGEDPQYFYSYSPEGYAVAINAVLYAMTH